MNDIRILRTAAIELANLDDTDVVKVAGVLRRIKNWWKAFNDPAYKERVEELREQSLGINDLLSSLGTEINNLQSSISDTDVESYSESLINVKDISARLAAALSGFQQSVSKAEQSAPEQVVNVPTAKDTPEKEGPARLQTYTLEQLKDPEIRQQLKSQLPPEYDVPLNTHIAKPVTGFGWFKALTPSDFYLSEEFISNFQKRLSEALGERKIRLTGDPKQDVALYSLIVQLPEVESQIRNKLPLAIIGGNLMRVDFQKPKQVTNRNANEMFTVIHTAPFEITLPANGIFEGQKIITVNAVCSLNDMRAAYIRGQHLSGAGVHYVRVISHDATADNRSVGLEKLSQAQNIHQWASKIIHDAFVEVMGREPTLGELQAAQSVAWIETGYGRGWGASKRQQELHDKFKLQRDPRAASSNNWGAVQTRSSKPPDCAGNAFRYVDTSPTSSGASVPYVICFKSYSSPLEGAKDLITHLYKGSGGDKVLSGANSGSLVQFSSAMYDKHYYEGFGKTPEERIANHVSALNGAMKKVVNKNEPGFDVQEKTDKSQLISQVAAYRGGAAQPSQQKLQVAPKGNVMQEYESLISRLACGPIESIVRKAIERDALPTTRILLVVQDGRSLPVRIRYARILASALREELGAETSIHNMGDRLEIESDVVGTEETVRAAVDGLSDGVSNAFALATGGGFVKTQSYNGLTSRYPLLSSEDSEANFRKFAFEMMVTNG